ncbi:MAG: hypothetical protein Q9N26_03775 [Aquificota bacterium]|nr:hypothetical protein [Aquificota bacterium]
MDRTKVLEKVLLYDRILRFTIDLLSGIREEIRADIEEARIIGESILTREETERLNRFLDRVSGEFMAKLDETLDSIYDEYEIFNFDITFLSSIPEEIERDINRLHLIDSINRNLEELRSHLLEMCDSEMDAKMKAVITPFKIYCKLIDHAIEFNKKFENF